MYQSYVFDLYGTLVDVRTREDSLLVWEKLILFYGYHDASYTPEELEEAYGRLVQSQEEMLVGDAVAHNSWRRREKAAGKTQKAMRHTRRSR